MEDVADVNIGRARENLSNWEDDSTPLAPLTPRERDSIIEVTAGGDWRPLPPGAEGEERGGEAGGGTSADPAKHRLHDSLAALKLGEVKIESSQQVRRHGCLCQCVHRTEMVDVLLIDNLHSLGLLCHSLFIFIILVISCVYISYSGKCEISLPHSLASS